MPPGFLGTDADILMDVVVCSLAIVLPLLVVSWHWVRAKRYTRHRNVMISLGSTLAVVVTIFEIDVRLAGGAFGLAKNSALAGTAVMSASIWIHLAIATFTALLWLTLIVVSLRRFPKPPAPTEAFSAKHRFWGRIGMAAMTLTGLTGIELYVVLFLF